ncbi:unnamed protein product [Pedinophyceae sp. YPF-701]|nr:unnamed protein product [Pedinophyceae sp. YPF-701]
MSRRLPTHAGSNVIVYMTGHGGKGFMKFHDKDMLLSEDLGLALDDMHAAGRYREMLLLVDTCEAATMLTGVRAPGITAVASSLRSQSSHSHMHNSEVGISAVDEFAYGVGKAMKEIDGYRSSMTLRQFLGIAASVVQQSDMSVVPPVVDGVREEGYIDARTAAHFMAPPPVPTSGGVVETYPTGLRF